MHTHFIGASAPGAAGLASLLRAAGDVVSASDDAFEPELLARLEADGVRCLRGFSAEHLVPPPDAVVVGRHVPRENPEVAFAEGAGLALASVTETLRARILVRRRPLVVTGCTQRAMTSAMCAWALHGAGTEAGWLLRDPPSGFPGAASGSAKVRPDRGRAPFVIDADQAESSCLRARPEFLDGIGLTPTDVAIVTGLEDGGQVAWPAAREQAYGDFVRAVPPGGLLVVPAYDARARAIVKSACQARTAFFAIEHDDTGDVTPTWLAAPVAPFTDGRAAFDLYAGGMFCGRFALRVPGLGPVRSAIACVAACAEGFGVDLGELRKQLGSFESVGRRDNRTWPDAHGGTDG